MKTQTLKGFRDFLPEQANARQFVVSKITEVFRLYGFEPLETPALEYEEVLAGKYGDEGDKLMYRFTDNGDRKVALRYDQTVPLARVVAQYPELPKPFKRYQIQPVWRAENTQKGRYREFLQCDADIVGTTSPLADAEIIACADNILQSLGFKKYVIKINTRALLFNKIKEAGISEDLSLKIIRIIDKVEKIGWPKMDQELLDLGIPRNQVSKLNSMLSVTQTIEQDPYLKEIRKSCRTLGVDESMVLQSKLYLARGLDYYTGLIFEIEIDGYTVGSVGGGGRYDKLIGLYSEQDIPAVGFAFGFDRLMEALEQFDLLPKNLSSAKVLVTIFNSDLMEKSLEVASRLRSKNINTEIYLDPQAKLDKQLKYADQKGIPFVVIIGPDEAKNKTVTLKDLTSKNQKTLPLSDLLASIK